jgi:hypothetical protein
MIPPSILKLSDMAKIPLLLLPGLNATFRPWQLQIQSLSDMAH